MEISQSERASGRLTEHSVSLAARTLRDAGYVILERVMPEDWVSAVGAAFHEELLSEAESGGVDLEKTNGHRNVFAPLRMPFMDPLIIENPFALQIIQAAMGEDVLGCLPYHSNNSWPGSKVQGVHRDTGQLFPRTPLVLPISMAVVNIPLVDFTLENGATEFWPGSHLIPDLDGDSGAHVAARAQQLPSVRLVMPAGSIAIRDLRCWHSGMPNRTEAVRTQLSLVYLRQFHRVPDDPRAFSSTISEQVWRGMSERARFLYRYGAPEQPRIS